MGEVTFRNSSKYGKIVAIIFIAIFSAQYRTEYRLKFPKAVWLSLAEVSQRKGVL